MRRAVGRLLEFLTKDASRHRPVSIAPFAAEPDIRTKEVLILPSACDECALALELVDHALEYELVERFPHYRSRHVELRAQFGFRRQTGMLHQRGGGDHVEDGGLDLRPERLGGAAVSGLVMLLVGLCGTEIVFGQI